MRNKIRVNYDIVIVGGGVSGVCAAIACSRHGAKTALIHNRPVLGGNASSEIRMHICGADHGERRPDARETGIIEEILLENRRINPSHCFSILDMVMWEKTHFQKGLDLYLNTHMYDVIVAENRIHSVSAIQLTTEKEYVFEADIFMDATGDGMLAAFAGAESMLGREGKDVFGEQYTPDISDDVTMGSSLMFRSVDMGKPTDFHKPEWADTYTEEDLALRDHSSFDSGYWWIELGGDELKIIDDGEEIRDKLVKAVFGVWDHIKNSGNHRSENYALDWVGFLPGKRESRRITGDYILKEQDCLKGAIFSDAVAYGGWPMDMHIPGGLKNRSKEPTVFIRLKDVYTIPYRCLYSKNIENLMIGGRAISCSHMAFGSTRVMATCAVVGQAGGTAAAMAAEKKITPREVLNHISELQQKLLKDDCYIPGVWNLDPNDLARYARVTASSRLPGGEESNVNNGISRKVKDKTNCWISDKLSNGGEWIMLDFQKEYCIKEVHLKFDSNLSKGIMMTMSEEARENQIPGIPPELVKDYSLEFYRNGQKVYEQKFENNYLRHRVHRFEKEIPCDHVKVNIFSTNGDRHARIFEIRAYG